MQEVVIRPIGVHQYFVKVRQPWESLVDNVLDIFNRTRKIVVNDDFELDLRLAFNKKSKLEENTRCWMFNTAESSVEDVQQCVLQNIYNQIPGTVKRIVIEVRYLQNDFVMDLDVYQKYADRLVPLVKHTEDAETIKEIASKFGTENAEFVKTTVQSKENAKDAILSDRW